MDSPGTPANPGVVKLETVRKHYEALAASSNKTSIPFDEVLSNDGDAERLQRSLSYAARLMATKAESIPGHLFINGKHTPMGGQWSVVVQSELGAQLSMLQEQVSRSISIQADQPDCSRRRNQ